MQVRRINETEFFTTMDNSKVMELFGIPSTGLKEVSLAYAVVQENGKTQEHYHNFIEIYMFANGRGIMHLNNEVREIKEGDNVLIPAKSWHYLENTGKEKLELYCVCIPAFTAKESVMKK